VLKKIAVLWNVKLYCWVSIVPGVLKCCTAFIFSAIYPLATHTCRALPVSALPGQHTVFPLKSSLCTAFFWRWRHGALQNFRDCSPTNASSLPRNWNLKFQWLDEVTRVISVLTLWCVLWSVPVMHCDAWDAGGLLWPLLCSLNLNCSLLYLITLPEG
jgi:hypothetical protein